MAFNDGSLLQVTTQDLIYGLREELGAFADVACKSFTRDALSGEEPIFATATTLAQAATGKAPGSTLEDRNTELTSVTYKMLEYAKVIDISKAVLVDLEQYMQPMADLASVLIRDVDSGIDAALAALIVNASFNTSHGAANGVWSLNTSTPVLDLQAAVDKTPGADTVILGHTTARELSRHPDFKEATSNYSGAGSMGFEQLRGLVGEFLQINPDRVLIFSKFYNSANEGQAAVVARRAGDLAWVGHSDGLRKYEQNYKPMASDSPNNGGLLSVVEEHNRWSLAYRRVLNIVRGDSALGCYLTGI